MVPALSRSRHVIVIYALLHPSLRGYIAETSGLGMCGDTLCHSHHLISYSIDSRRLRLSVCSARQPLWTPHHHHPFQVASSGHQFRARCTPGPSRNARQHLGVGSKSTPTEGTSKALPLHGLEAISNHISYAPSSSDSPRMEPRPRCVRACCTVCCRCIGALPTSCVEAQARHDNCTFVLFLNFGRRAITGFNLRRVPLL